MLDGEAPEPATCELEIPGYAAEVVIGGWPALIDADEQIAARLNRGYIDTIVEVDIHNVDDVHRDPVRVRRFLHAFAQLVAHPAKQSTIVRRATGIDTSEDAASPSRWSTAAYLDALTRLMLVEDQPAWQPALRSRSRLVGTPKRHLADPSLAAAVLQRDRQGLLRDLNTFGFLFESLVIRDLRVYAPASLAVITATRYAYLRDDGVAVIPAATLGP